jgi:uncharacterized RDD family membrane protein YckC
MKPISEITIEKTIVRMRRTRNGDRFNEVFSYLESYNPTTFYGKRIGAKIIDMGIYFFLTLIIYLSINPFSIKEIRNVFLATGFIYLIINTILETEFGSTVGKYLLKLTVIDNFGQKPSVILCLKRNFVLTVIYLSAFTVLIFLNFVGGIDTHNRLSGTYVVEKKELPEIIKKIKEE